jgi:hypothetical protein
VGEQNSIEERVNIQCHTVSISENAVASFNCHQVDTHKIHFLIILLYEQRDIPQKVTLLLPIFRSYLFDFADWRPQISVKNQKFIVGLPSNRIIKLFVSRTIIWVYGNVTKSPFFK